MEYKKCKQCGLDFIYGYSWRPELCQECEDNNEEARQEQQAERDMYTALYY